jgi:hypothetical protein
VPVDACGNPVTLYTPSTSGSTIIYRESTPPAKSNGDADATKTPTLQQDVTPHPIDESGKVNVNRPTDAPPPAVEQKDAGSTPSEPKQPEPTTPTPPQT